VRPAPRFGAFSDRRFLFSFSAKSGLLNRTLYPKHRMKTTRFHKLHRAGRLAGTCLLLLAVSGAEAPATASSKAKAPPVKEVIAKYIQALGGRETILKQSYLRAQGKLEMPGQGVDGTLEVLRAKPNKQMVRIQIPNMGKIEIGFDGTVGWMTNPFSEPMLLEGKMLDQARDEADFHNQLHDEKNFKSMETVGTTQFEGQECYEVKLVQKSGRQTTEYFDVKTGLMAGLKATQETPQGEVGVTTRFREWKKFGDLLQPTKMTQKLGENDQMIAFDTVSMEPIPDKEFEQPDAVKKLVKEKGAPAK
jgi:hypothetical protein